MTRLLQRLAAVTIAALLAACASTPPGQGLAGTGVVNSISEVREASRGSGIAGAVGGAIVGGSLGSLFGGGTGRTIASSAGAAIGATAGQKMGSDAGAVTAWDVSVRFDDGIDRVVRMYQQPGVRPGQKVRVINGAVVPL